MFKFSYIMILTFFLNVWGVNAQNTFKCGTDEIRQANLNDPDFALKEQLREAEIQEIIENKKLLRNSTDSEEEIYRIPVVFHSLQGEEFSETNELVVKFAQRNIDKLNAYFNNETNNLNTGFEFYLADIDPDDNPTDGVNFVDMTGNLNFEEEGIIFRSDKKNYKTIYDKHAWPNSKYLNIFVAEYITFYKSDGSSETPNGIGIRKGVKYSGVYLDILLIINGSNGISHEVGHYLNLMHTFQGNTSDNICPENDQPYVQGDFCADTPPHKNYIIRAPDINDCTGKEFEDNIKYNIMSYFEVYTELFIFTQDQKDRMRASYSNEDISYLFPEGHSETVYPFTRLVSEDRKCEAGFYPSSIEPENVNIQFAVRTFNYDGEYAYKWSTSFTRQPGDNYFQAFGDLTGVFRITAAKDGKGITKWKSNNPPQIQSLSTTKLENRGSFTQPNCVLSVNYGSETDTWVQTDGGSAVDTKIITPGTPFPKEGKSFLKPDEKLIPYNQEPLNEKEFNYLLSEDGIKMTILDESLIRVIENNEENIIDFNNTIQTFELN